MAKKEDTAETVEQTVEEPVEKRVIPQNPGLYPDEFYTIKLPRSSRENKDVTVGVNGEFFKIKRGVEVTVPAAVYEVLKNSERMEDLAYERRKAMQEKVK